MPQTFESAGGGQPQFRGPNPLPPDPYQGYDLNDVTRAKAMFTRGNSQSDIDAQRIGWLENQRQQNRKLDIEMTRAKNPLGIAQLKGQNYNERTQAQLQMSSDKLRTQAEIAAGKNLTTQQVAARTSAINLIRSQIAAGTFDVSDPKQQRAITQAAAIAGMPPQQLVQMAAQPPGQQPAQGGAGNLPPTRTVNGVTYTLNPATGKYRAQQ